MYISIVCFVYFSIVYFRGEYKTLYIQLSEQSGP